MTFQQASKTVQQIEKENYYASLIVKNAGAFTQANLNLTGKVTRSQMAKIITNTFGLEKAAGYESTITDIAHLDAETKGYIETIASHGVTNVTTFNPAGTVTRSQMASFLVRSYDVVNPVVVAPEVVSVSATNLKQVQVTLSGDVDLEEVLDKTNYSFEDAAGDSIAIDNVALPKLKVAANNTVVTITLVEAVSNQGKATITVDKAVTGKEFTQVVEFFDTTIPVVVGAEVVGNATIKVKFSEPIDFGELDENGLASSAVENAFSVNDGEFFIKSVKPLQNGTEANVELYSSIAKRNNYYCS